MEASDSDATYERSATLHLWARCSHDIVDSGCSGPIGNTNISCLRRNSGNGRLLSILCEINRSR